ncbi:MAG: cobyric acid synthase CobQ, partial [Chloroflexaceae bacterium]|nr:cobyric acid synthase CobQ [Chloroflexaceae bacterium]
AGWVEDPLQLEGEDTNIKGLGLLPLQTILEVGKVVRQRQVVSHYPIEGLPVEGYEMHQGRTQLLDLQSQAAYRSLFEDESLGLVSDSGTIWGCYLHGIFDNGPWRRGWLNHLRQRRGLPSLPTGVPSYREQRDGMLEALADLVETHLDLAPVLEC